MVKLVPDSNLLRMPGRNSSSFNVLRFQKLIFYPLSVSHPSLPAGRLIPNKGEGNESKKHTIAHTKADGQTVKRNVLNDFLQLNKGCSYFFSRSFRICSIKGLTAGIRSLTASTRDFFLVKQEEFPIRENSDKKGIIFPSHRKASLRHSWEKSTRALDKL